MKEQEKDKNERKPIKKKKKLNGRRGRGRKRDREERAKNKNKLPSVFKARVTRGEAGISCSLWWVWDLRPPHSQSWA